MEQIVLDMYQSAAIGAAVLGLGIFLIKRSSVLRRFCIPSAVIGGLLFSVIMLFLYEGDIAEISFDETFKDVCMRIFFCSIGFMASLSMLKSGGKMIAIMVILVIALVFMQNVVGILSVSLFDLDPKYGLALGSISLCGGHGTAAAYGEVLVEDYGLEGGDVVAIASATFGLALAGILGGPLSRKLVKKNNLTSSYDAVNDKTEKKSAINGNRFLQAVMLILICLGVGTLINEAMDAVGITLPSYLGALISAIVIRNLADLRGFDVPAEEIELIGWLCLGVFLSMALMAIKLWQLADLAAAMVVTLAIQTILLCAYVYYVVFRATGRTYESAAMCAGTMGFGMGATPNAVANLQALSDEYGPAPKAYFIIPLIGGVFMDLINVTELTFFLNLL